MHATIWKLESKNSQEYHHVVCGGVTNHPVEKGLLRQKLAGVFVVWARPHIFLVIELWVMLWSMKNGLLIFVFIYIFSPCIARDLDL